MRTDVGRHLAWARRVAVPSITADGASEMDRLTTHDVGVSNLEMMELSGASLASLALRMLGPRRGRGDVLVVARGGGNGGGVLTAARRLSGWNVPVRVALADIGIPLDVLCRLGVEARPIFRGRPVVSLRRKPRRRPGERGPCTCGSSSIA